MGDHPVPLEGLIQNASDKVRELLAGKLDADPEEIGWDDELTAIGVDSIALMAVLEWFLAVSGVRVPYADAVASRTVAGLGRLLASYGSEPCRVDPGRAPAPVPAQVDDAQPFALSVMSQAYWAGQHIDEGAESVVAHFYHEFDGAAIDPRRMEHACRLLYERNPMLRAVVTADGAQYVRPLPDDWALPVDDLRDFDEAGLTARLQEIREQRAQQNMRPDRGEVFQVWLALLPEGRSRTFVKLYMGVGDALSFKMALEQLAALYKDPDEPWDEPGMTYAQYITAMAAGGDPAPRQDARGALVASW